MGIAENEQFKVRFSLKESSVVILIDVYLFLRIVRSNVRENSVSESRLHF